MVCEVAIFQTLKSVMEKKYPYLLGPKNKVRFNSTKQLVTPEGN